MDDTLAQIANWLTESQAAVAFTGAGISTESGIPDFRSPGGVWANNRTVYYDEFLASLEGRREYWRQKSMTHSQFRDNAPNAGHSTLAKWEAAGRLRGVITQNIDGYHQRAGSQNVLELHGTAAKVGCVECDYLDDADPWVTLFQETNTPPHCPECGGYLKHATVSFGQQMPEKVMQEAIQLSRVADLYFAIGSSLVVEPAATLPRLAEKTGARLVIINRDPTPLDELADAIVPDGIGSVLTAIDDML